MAKTISQLADTSALPLLRVRDLAIAAGSVILPGQINLDLFPGELVAVTGPSGSGKTTLLRTVTGLQQPVSGSVKLAGKEAQAWGWPEFRRKMTLVTQRPTLLDLTVAENLRRPFLYRTATASFPLERAKSLLEELAVGAERLEQNAQTLSVGQQQRVCLIRALLLEPLVLCMDEPTSALDPDAARRVESLISREAEQRGLAALIVTHNQQQAEQWCRRSIAMPAAGAPSTEPKVEQS